MKRNLNKISVRETDARKYGGNETGWRDDETKKERKCRKKIEVKKSNRTQIK